ncbi:unnamed protein product [Protopolystoma xenopodis]|uniref:Uncharacterized protein n=1 Tax=Protopolystoma xenopodis TaxID=117903 RepID=A0A3S5BUE3_9PLAT|nr:unnamed protein product [Protopolystoma xenopodis]
MQNLLPPTCANHEPVLTADLQSHASRQTTTCSLIVKLCKYADRLINRKRKTMLTFITCYYSVETESRSAIAQRPDSARVNSNYGWTRMLLQRRHPELPTFHAIQPVGNSTNDASSGHHDAFQLT